MTLNTPLSVSGHSVSTITPRYVDDPSAKVVTMASPGMVKSLTLWQGAAYDAIGEWTNADAEARIQALADSGDLAACFDW